MAIPSTLAGNATPVLLPGKPGQVDVIYIGAAYGQFASTVPVVVWNGTSEPVNNVDVSGPALLNGSVVGSGDSQDIQPKNLEPGQAAFGMVFFENAVPAGATFQFTATSSPGTSTYFLDAKVVQANFISGELNAVAGTVENPNSIIMSGPISADVYCFTGGNLTAIETGFLSGNGNLSPGATGSYSTTVTDPCSSYLVGASGFGQV